MKYVFEFEMRNTCITNRESLIKGSISMSYILWYIMIHVCIFISVFDLDEYSFKYTVRSQVVLSARYSVSPINTVNDDSRKFGEISGQVETSEGISQEVNQRTWLARSRRDFEWRKLCILSIASDSIFIYWITGD